MTPAPIDVDGARPAVAILPALFAMWSFSDAEREVLTWLAIDSFDGEYSAPGIDNLAAWTGMFRGRTYEAVATLVEADPAQGRPPMLARTKVGKRTRLRFLFVALVLEPSRNTGQLNTDTSIGADGQPSGDTGRLEADKSGEPSGEPSGEASGNTGHTLPFLPEPPLGEENDQEVTRARPDPRCLRHRGVADPPACVACRDARLAAEAYDAQEGLRAKDQRRTNAAAEFAANLEALRHRLDDHYSPDTIRRAANYEMPDNPALGLRLLAARIRTADDAAIELGRWD